MSYSRSHIILVVVFPILALMGLAGYHQILKESGREVAFAIKGYDPRDLLSGHYLTFQVDYKTSQPCAGNGESFLCVGTSQFSKELPQNCTTFIRGSCNAGTFKAGIERFYIPETHQHKLEDALRDKESKILVSVSSNGTAQIKDLLIDGRSWKDF